MSLVMPDRLTHGPRRRRPVLAEGIGAIASVARKANEVARMTSG